MKEEIILKKAIEKAVKNGWKPKYVKDILSISIDKKDEEIDIVTKEEKRDDGSVYSSTIYTIDIKKCYDTIFSHDFAKAFWGISSYNEDCIVRTPNWQHHLKLMVLEKNPL